MSLRIKRDSGSGGVYVVLASKASGNYQYYPFDAEEFDSFVDAAIEIRKRYGPMNRLVSVRPKPPSNRDPRTPLTVVLLSLTQSF
ncbi:hypothetical protein NL154_08680 [Rhizobium sp. YTUHZ044]|uniref:hypothetical protein n=1 Tax=Rhizobium sp. YTUHZ044 TaxID=2962678 RepID=UPI003DA9B5CD